MTYIITKLYDQTDCETCGSSYAEGYTIHKNGELVVDKTPFAHCYDGTDYYAENPYKDILNLLSVEFEEVEQKYYEEDYSDCIDYEED